MQEEIINTKNQAMAQISAAVSAEEIENLRIVYQAGLENSPNL